MKPHVTYAPNPYGETINSSDVYGGTAPLSYTEVGNYPAPGPIGHGIRRAFGGFFRWANARHYPGLRGTVDPALYSIATSQTFMRPSSQRAPDPGTRGGEGIPTGINRR
jgi:hypothetical protein